MRPRRLMIRSTPSAGTERVAEDLSRLLANPVNAASALDQANDRPRQIVVDDDRGVLQVLPFAQDIGRDQDPEFPLAPRQLRLPLERGLKRQASRVGSADSAVTPASRVTPSRASWSVR